MFVLPLLPLPATLLLRAHAHCISSRRTVCLKYAQGMCDVQTRQLRGHRAGSMTREEGGVSHLLMLVLPPFHPLFCTLLRKQDPGISDCSRPHTRFKAHTTPLKLLLKALCQGAGTAAASLLEKGRAAHLLLMLVGELFQPWFCTTLLRAGHSERVRTCATLYAQCTHLEKQSSDKQAWSPGCTHSYTPSNFPRYPGAHTLPRLPCLGGRTCC